MECPYCHARAEGEIFCPSCDACLLAEDSGTEPPPISPVESATHWLLEYQSGRLNLAQLILRLNWLLPVLRELIRQLRLHGPGPSSPEQPRAAHDMFLDAMRLLDQTLAAILDNLRAANPTAVQDGLTALQDSADNFHRLGQYMDENFSSQELERLTTGSLEGLDFKA